ncbi:MAG: hypothetical protein IJY28_03475, partial [Clostridia bacterium]|nr:hypothetical protein [Clostridia bacterium]
FMMAAMLVFFTGMAKPPASAGQTKIIIESHNGRHHASIHPQMGYVYPEILEQRFTLSLLPEGYTLTEQWDRWSDLESYTTWTNPQGNKIVLMQDTLNTGLELNVDSAPGKSVRVGRYRGQLFVCQEHIVLLWTTDYTLMLEVYDPKVTPEQVLAMAAGLVEVSAGRP